MLHLTIEEHKRLCEIYKENAFNVASTHRTFQHIVPHITYDQTKVWVTKPLQTSIDMSKIDNWYFLGCLCSIKSSLIKSYVKIPSSFDRDLVRYINKKYKQCCDGEKIYSNNISNPSIIDMMNILTNELVLGMDSEDEITELTTPDQLDMFIRGFMRGACKEYTPDRIRIPMNAFLFEDFATNHQPLTYERHYNTWLFVSYSARKLHDLIAIPT